MNATVGAESTPKATRAASGTEATFDGENGCAYMMRKILRMSKFTMMPTLHPKPVPFQYNAPIAFFRYR